MANLNVMGESLSDQFRNLKGRHPGQWPIVPRMLLAMLAMVVVIVAGWAFYWKEQLSEQERGQAKELSLKDEYRVKIQQAVNLDMLKSQKKQVSAYVTSLEKQLPGKAQIESLLSDINTAGVGRGLHIELIKPGSTIVNDYYSELPIEIKVSGSYHDIGAFTGDIANLSRIVTLNSLELITTKDNNLTLIATAKTFRYLDADEVAETRKAAAAKKKEKGGKK
jgi:type IV pilus assembly protein PilO